MPQRYLFTTRVITGLILIVIYVTTPVTAFASPALEAFMQQVWANNPSVKSAESALAAAKANSTAAQQPIYNPEIGFDLERTDINTMSIGVSQRVDWGDKRLASTNMADAGIRLAQAELSLRRLKLAEEILTALVNIQSTSQMQHLAQQRVDLMEEFVINTEKREQAGDIGLQDVALARVALSEAKMQLAKTASEQAKNDANLQAATGIFTSDWPVLEKEPPSLPASFNVDEYLEHLPKLTTIKAQLAAAKSNINLAKATTKADPNFGLRGGVEDSNALLGLTFSMPFNIRNNFKAEVEVASQEALQIELMFLSEMQRAKAHIYGVHRRYQITYAAWQSWKKTGMSSLVKQMELIRRIWKLGEMSTSDYLVQAKQNVDAQVTAVELSAQMREAWVEWLVVSGQIQH